MDIDAYISIIRWVGPTIVIVYFILLFLFFYKFKKEMNVVKDASIRLKILEDEINDTIEEAEYY